MPMTTRNWSPQTLSEKIKVNGVGIDISKGALEVCRLNIKRFKLENSTEPRT